MEAVCGGMAMCATCHCFILNDIELPEKGDIEEALLSELFTSNSISRLALSNSDHKRTRWHIH